MLWWDSLCLQSPNLQNIKHLKYLTKPLLSYYYTKNLKIIRPGKLPVPKYQQGRPSSHWSWRVERCNAVEQNWMARDCGHSRLLMPPIRTLNKTPTPPRFSCKQFQQPTLVSTPKGRGKWSTRQNRIQNSLISSRSKKIYPTQTNPRFLDGSLLKVQGWCRWGQETGRIMPNPCLSLFLSCISLICLSSYLSSKFISSPFFFWLRKQRGWRER